MNSREKYAWEHMSQKFPMIECSRCGFAGMGWHTCSRDVDAKLKKDNEKLLERIEALEKSIHALKTEAKLQSAKCKEAEGRAKEAELRYAGAKRRTDKAEQELADLKEVMLKVLVRFVRAKGKGRIEEAMMGELVEMAEVGETMKKAASV